MKLVFVISLFLACPAVALAADEEAQGRLDAKAEACISAGAPEVVRTETNLSTAVDFLVNDLCAREAEIAGRYRANRKVLDLLIRQQKSTMATVAALKPPTEGEAAPMPATGQPSAQNAAAVKQEKKLAGLEAARVSSETGEIEGLQGPFSLISDLANIVFGLRSPQASPDFRAFAARAVLTAREATR